MKTVLLLILMAVPVFISAQKEASFTSIVEDINKDLAQYEKLSPFGEEYLAINGLGLSRKERNELILASDYDANLTKNKDSIAQYEMIFYYQDRIISQLKKLLKHPDFEKNDIANRITGDELSIVKSADNKLYNFSLDEKTGGSYRSRLSIMHYTDLVIQDSSDIDPYSVFEGDGYNEIFMLHTEQEVKYVLTGSVRGCSYCFQTFVQLVSFENNALNLDFEYSTNNRDWNDGAYYNHDTKTIDVNYHVDDLTPFCDCGDDNETYFDFDENESEYGEIRCECKFVFNGKTFDLVKGGWEKVEQEK